MKTTPIDKKGLPIGETKQIKSTDRRSSAEPDVDPNDRGHDGEETPVEKSPEQIQHDVDSKGRAIVDLDPYGILPEVWTMKDVADHMDVFDNYILVEHVAPPNRTKGGILLPENSAIRENLENQLYRVVKAGPGRVRNHETGDRIAMRVKNGDIAVMRLTAAVKFCQQKRDYFIARDDDVVAVLHDVEVETDNERVED